MGDQSFEASIQKQLRDQSELLGRLNTTIQVLAVRVETRIPLADGFDDRIARVEGVERRLATATMKLGAAKAMTSWWSGAMAGAVAGAVVAYFFLHSAIALAH